MHIFLKAMDVLKPLTSIVLFASGLLFSSSAFSALEAVELTNVPTDILASCNRSFFKSSNEKERALYVTPHVVAGRSPIAGGEKEVFIDPTEDPDKFRLVIGIFFPRDSGDNTNFYEMRDAQANYCNFEAVKRHLNKHLEEENKYVKIVHIPVNQVMVSLPSVGGQTVKPTRKVVEQDEENRTVVFEYVDRSFVAEFEIDRKELNEVNVDFSRGSGLPVLVTFDFESRQNDGEVIVHIDAQSVKTNFEAQASGKPPYMGKAEVKAMLQTAFDSQNMQIEVKGGITESSESALDKVIDLVLSSVSFSTKAAEIEAGEFSKTDGDSDYVNIEVVASAIISKLNQDFSYRRTTAAMKTEVEVPVNVSSTPIDPYVKDFYIRDGFNAKKFPTRIDAGQSIRISPGFAYQVTRHWGEKRQYITKGQISDLGFPVIYPFMYDSQYSYENIVGDLGTYALGKDCGGLSWRYLLGMCVEYKFMRIQRFPTDEIRSNHFHYGPRTPKDFYEIPMYVAFTGIDAGQKIFTLDGLLKASQEPGSKFSARIDGESILIEAHEDLGLMKLGDRFKSYDLEKSERVSPNDNDVIRIYSASPEHPEGCSGLVRGGDTSSCDWPEGVLLDYKNQKTGAYIFSFRADEVITDEALIDFHWGWNYYDENRMDKRAELETDHKTNGMPIDNRVDSRAIKAYRGFYVGVSWPFETPESSAEVEASVSDKDDPEAP